MKILELIHKLGAIYVEHGDLDVITVGCDCDAPCSDAVVGVDNRVYLERD